MKGNMDSLNTSEVIVIRLDRTLTSNLRSILTVLINFQDFRYFIIFVIGISMHTTYYQNTLIECTNNLDY